MPSTYVLRLRSTAQLDSVALSCDNFATAPATIALSEHIRVAFSTVGMPEADLGHGELTGTALEIWNRTARAVLDEASDSDSQTFFVRHIHSPDLPRTVQIRTRTEVMSQWLAHPLLFTQLHHCVSTVFGTDDAVFHVLGPDAVVATQGDIDVHQLDHTGLDINPDCFFPQLRFHQGFPVASELVAPQAEVPISL
ncbi:hypothetical protein [Corynebacterium sp. H130]|uniref:hypothetical protein n=1 Tax=Corynebacterium sp. H130 TaxID=3133444 RepID=UPI003095569B